MSLISPVLSICIPVYNQIELVSECINHIMQCKSCKIEVIVNDDCSAQPIETVVRNYGDYRIKYFRNSQNLGHDRNIVASFKRATSNYCFLLRSRDFIIPEGLESIIRYLENHKCAYLTTSAYDSSNVPKLLYENAVYKQGEEALRAHNSLYVHPSGSVYNKNLINLQVLDDFLCDQRITKYNFTVHSLIRMQLALLGDFITLRDYSWVYSDTAGSKDIAVNSSQNSVSVYDTEYELERYKTEMFWCNKVIDNKFRLKQFLLIFSKFLYASTWNNKLVYENKQLRKHYNFKYRKVNCNVERQRFEEYSEMIEKELHITNASYFIEKYKIIKKNKTTDRLKYFFLLIRSKFPFKSFVKTAVFCMFPKFRLQGK